MKRCWYDDHLKRPFVEWQERALTKCGEMSVFMCKRMQGQTRQESQSISHLQVFGQSCCVNFYIAKQLILCNRTRPCVPQQANEPHHFFPNRCKCIFGVGLQEAYAQWSVCCIAECREAIRGTLGWGEIMWPDGRQTRKACLSLLQFLNPITRGSRR